MSAPTYTPDAAFGVLSAGAVAVLAAVSTVKWAVTVEARLSSAGAFEVAMGDEAGPAGEWLPVSEGQGLVLPVRDAHRRLWVRNRDADVHLTLLGSATPAVPL